MELFKEFRFEAAHFLPNVPEDHPCGRLHGHSFRVRLYLEGPVDQREGWVVDFRDVEEAFRPHLAQLDHRLLNEVEGLENPTSEIIARWVWDRLRPECPRLRGVRVQETPDSGAFYRDPDYSSDFS